MTEKVLVTGACGQIGTELVLALAAIYGVKNVIASDIRKPNHDEFENILFEILNVMDQKSIEEIVKKHQITEVYHLAAMLSATAEKHPMKGWQLNMNSLLYFLELAKDKLIKKLYWPSSIAVFGRDVQSDFAPQNSPTHPATVYGISKVSGEMWSEYYHNKYGVDVRSLRYPGLISWKAQAGGGTTDYAVEIYYEALQKGAYTSFLSENQALPMMYMSDAIRATIALMQANSEKLSIRTSYNLNGFSLTGKQMTESIQKFIPDFKVAYEPDFREEIADSWPNSIDDSIAQKDWGWSPEYNLDNMTKEMLTNLNKKLCKEDNSCAVKIDM